MAATSTTDARSFTYGEIRSTTCVVAALIARSYGTRFTSRLPDLSSALARSCTALVTSVSAGPPLGGLYLNPPSAGGLCDGVMMIPSASPAVRPWFRVRISQLTTGVGVALSPSARTVSTPLAASTSRAVRWAGPDRACVSRPMTSGPSMPLAARYSTIAWVMAAMWASVNVPSDDVPRWPLVPKLTSWRGSATSGVRSW